MVVRGVMSCRVLLNHSLPGPFKHRSGLPLATDFGAEFHPRTEARNSFIGHANVNVMPIMHSFRA